MSFLAPAALGLISLAIPLVVLYMLRSRRRRLEVPSVRMWEDEEQFVSAALPWQRLKITAALLLQLLALIAFAVLLARPFFREETLLGPHTVLVMDTSGSMAMAGRLDAARDEARRLAADASADQLVSVVEAGSRPRVLVAFSRDPEAIRAAVDGLQAGGGVQDLAGALRLARGLATPDRPTSLLVMSDGGLDGELEEPISGARHLTFDAVDDNVAITGFGTGVPGEGGARVFLEVSSFSNRREVVTAELRVDGLRVATVDVDLEPGARQQEIVALDAGPGQTVEVELVEHEDALALDDRSAIVLGGGTDLAVTVVGESSPFLAALVAALEGIRPAAGEPPDVAIIDGASAADVDRPAWLIAPDPPPPGVRITGRLDNPVVTFQRSAEPLLDGLDLSELAIAEADIIEAAGWLPLVSAGDVPLVLLGEVGGHRTVYFTFDLVRSNLPVQVSFPILGARILEYLGGSRVATAATAAAGTAIPLAPPPGAVATVAGPDGSVRTLAEGVVAFDATDRPGVYTIEYTSDDGTVVGSVVAARQFVASESPGPSRLIITSAGEDVASEETSLLREWGPAILAGLLTLVLLEWWVAYGRPLPRRRSVPA
jgi:hypothetical protein